MGMADSRARFMADCRIPLRLPLLPVSDGAALVRAMVAKKKR